MLRDDSTAYGADGWMDSASAGTRQREWKRVDDRLRSLAKKYVSLEAELARWLREAQRIKAWKHAGCVSMNEYLERLFGFTPRQARDRVLVARRLGDLPVLEAALNAGELTYSAVRELSRVVLPSTEVAWVEHARGTCLGEIEDAVSQRQPGDLPGDPPRPDATPLRMTFEVKPETYALLRQVRQLLEDECGHSLDGDALLSAILNAVVAPADAEARKGRAKFMIALTTCIWCQRTVQQGGGKMLAINGAALERAQCDSQCIGSLDAEEPSTATQDVPPRVRRLVFQRDGYRCRVPGCRSARFLEVHHIVHREHGGTHDPSNLILLCDGHHTKHHDGVITIGGRAPDQLRFARGSRRDGGGRRLPMDDDPSFAMTHVGRAHDDPSVAMTHVGRAHSDALPRARPSTPTSRSPDV
jgi:hypothetical protein